MGENNIAPNTQIGKIIIPEKIYNNENSYNIDPERYSRSGEFIENISTDNFIEGCHRWFKLANFGEMIDDIDEYFDVLNYGKFSNLINAGMGNYYSPIIPTVSKVKSPVKFTNKKVYQPLVFNTRRDENLNYKILKEEQENADRIDR